MAKRISTEAYQALRDALPVVTWNKRPFETLLRTALRDHPELLIGLNFSDTKRNVSDQLIDTLIAREDMYQDVTLQLMLEIASMTRFPNVEQIKEPEDRKKWLDVAERAVAHLRSVTKVYAAKLASEEVEATARKAAAAQAAAMRKFNDDISALKDRFLEMQRETDTHQRGYGLESLLADLFLLYDLEPRMAYRLDLEQIDGAFSFDTDDYIVEARWRQDRADRADGDVFATKVETKGKNATGLFVSITGFTENFLKRFETSTPFITLDGGDLFMVLDGRVRLDDLLRAKKRHANETGSAYLPASAYISS
jgi:hypothetical protein